MRGIGVFRSSKSPSDIKGANLLFFDNKSFLICKIVCRNSSFF